MLRALGLITHTAPQHTTDRHSWAATPLRIQAGVPDRLRAEATTLLYTSATYTKARKSKRQVEAYLQSEAAEVAWPPAMV